MRRLFATLSCLAIFALCGTNLFAHALHFTRVVLSAAETGEVELRVETDLTPPLVDAAGMASLPAAEPAVRAQRLTDLAQDVLAQLEPSFSPPAEKWGFVSADFLAADPALPRAADEPASIALVWRSRLAAAPDGDVTLVIRSRADARISFPVACSVIPPGETQALTRWLKSPGDATQPFTWKLVAPGSATASASAGSSQAPHAAPEPAGRLATIGQYLWLGFLHILPLGLDHILFVLGLYFLGSGWRALAAQIGTFTLAHTTTLGLAAAGLVHAPASVVEPLIALSISFVALENIFRPRVGPGRLVAVFCFGLLHGLGFAGALSELELPRDQFFTALISFNFGVDFGQLAVLALAFLTVGWFRQKTWYRRAVAVPACSLIAATGLYWTIERAFF